MRFLNNCLRTKARAKWVAFVTCSICMLLIAKLHWLGRFSYAPDSIELAPGPEARRLSPTELMSRPLNNSHLSIPRLIHQSWKSSYLPAKFGVWSKTCRKKHPDWEWVLWTDEDNLQLVKTHLPWLLPVYNKLPSPIYRADLVRNAYMYVFGG
jgi:mannosyltransferase OCH1-like enzyme